MKTSNFAEMRLGYNYALVKLLIEAAFGYLSVSTIPINFISSEVKKQLRTFSANEDLETSIEIRERDEAITGSSDVATVFSTNPVERYYILKRPTKNGHSMSHVIFDFRGTFFETIEEWEPGQSLGILNVLAAFILDPKRKKS